MPQGGAQHCRKAAHNTKKCTVASWRDISPSVKIPTPCVWQASLSIFGWGIRSGFDELALIEPHLTKLHKYDARCCIIFTELKSVARRALARRILFAYPTRRRQACLSGVGCGYLRQRRNNTPWCILWTFLLSFRFANFLEKFSDTLIFCIAGKAEKSGVARDFEPCKKTRLLCVCVHVFSRISAAIIIIMNTKLLGILFRLFNISQKCTRVNSFFKF